MNTNTQRYEVVADYPSSTYKIGDILHSDTENMSAFFGKYPHLFRLLKWWECLAIDELPKYVKCKYSGWDGVYKVDEWVASVSHKGQYYTVLVDGSNGCQAWGHICVPATEAEYQDYLTKLKGK